MTKLRSILLAALATTCIPSWAVTVDIRNFGARCDGANDDAAAIQAAFDAVPATGGTVNISCFAAIGSQGILLANKSNVVVTGSATGAGFRAIGKTNIGIPGLFPVLFVVRNCQKCTIKDLRLKIENLDESGFGIEASTETTVQNLNISNTGFLAQAGIVTIGNRKNRYIGNTVTDSPKGSQSNVGPRGMWIGNGDKALTSQTEWYPYIEGNTVLRTGGTGIATHAIGAEIVNNRTEDTDGAGIKLVPPDDVVATSIVRGNTARRNTFHGVQTQAAHPIVIEKNTLESNAMAGILAANHVTNGLQVLDNVLRGNAECGIMVHTARNAVIRGNQIAGAAPDGKLQNNGIVFTVDSAGGIQNVTVENNVIQGNTTTGIHLRDRGGNMSTAAFRGNTVSNNPYGMYIERHGGTISGVTLSSTCFSGNRWANLVDERGLLPAPASSASCSEGTAPDVTPPTVSINSPFNGQVLTGTVTLYAQASDNSGVARVVFLVDGQQVAQATTSPYTASWDSRTSANGARELRATAFDAAGNQATASIRFTVSNTVADTTAPVISNLSARATGPNAATVTWNTSEPATSLVEFGPTNTFASSATVSQSLSTTHTANLAGLSPGTIYHVRARSRDYAGNEAVSNPVTVTTPTATANPAPGNWYNSAWSYRKRMTVNAGKVVASTPLSDFPMLVSIQGDSEFGSAQANGQDLLFTASDGRTKLSHEIEVFDRAAGKLVAWVRVPTLSGSTVNGLYLYFGNPAAPDQQDAANVWGTDFSGVWHLDEAGQHQDSTRNNHIASSYKTVASGAPIGKIGDADQFSRGGSNYVQIPGTSALKTGDITIEAWVKANPVGWASQDVVSIGDDVNLRVEVNGIVSFYVYDGQYRWTTFKSDIRGGFHHIAGVVDSAARTMTIYVDGVARSSMSTAGPKYVHGRDLFIGMNGYPQGNYNLDGIVDEVRVSNTVRRADWLKTQYNNQSDPSSFHSVSQRESRPN